MGSDLISELSSGWTVKPLIECTTDKIISYGIVQPGSHIESGIPIIRVNNFGNGQLDLSTVLKVDPEIEKKFSRTRLAGGEVLLTLVGSTGQSIVAPEELAGWNVPRAVAVIRVNGEVGAEWVNICLQTEFTKHFLDSRANTTVQKTLNLTDVKKIPIPIPPDDVKQFIESNITSLDNKIELNRQTNQTLEQMAQALFKSWFVDFDPVIDNALAADKPIPEELQARAQRRQQQLAKPDHQPFPSEFEETDALGWVPKGWISKPFGELLDQTIGGDWGKEVPDDKHTVESVIVRGTDIPRLASGSQSSAPTRWVEPKKLKTRSLSDSDIVIEVSGGSPTQPTGRSIMMTENLLVRLGGTVEPASFCRKFRPINKEIGLVLGLHLQKIYADGKTWEYQNTSTGISNFQTKTFLSSELVLMPDNVELINKFYSLTRPYIDKMTSNDSIKLESLRDTLLPKLISGELRLPESLLDSETNPPESAYE
jgi:type I restriction enzyme S subunit